MYWFKQYVGRNNCKEFPISVIVGREKNLNPDFHSHFLLQCIKMCCLQWSEDSVDTVYTSESSVVRTAFLPLTDSEENIWKEKKQRATELPTAYTSQPALGGYSTHTQSVCTRWPTVGKHTGSNKACSHTLVSITGKDLLWAGPELSGRSRPMSKVVFGQFATG